LQKLIANWTILITLTAFLLIGCAGSSSVKQEQDKSQGAPVADAKVPPQARNLYDNALAAMKGGDIARAKSVLTDLTHDYPSLSGPYVNLGIIHFRADEIDQAEKDFQQALKVNPDSAVSLNHLGIINRGKGKFEEAKEDYEKALAIDPNYAYAHLNYGILLDLYLGKLDDALHHYQKFQELAPGKDKEVEKWIIDLQRRIKKGDN